MPYPLLPGPAPLLLGSLSVNGDSICWVGIDAEIGPTFSVIPTFIPTLPLPLMPPAAKIPEDPDPNEFSIAPPLPPAPPFLFIDPFLFGMGCAELTGYTCVGALSEIWLRPADVPAAPAGCVRAAGPPNMERSAPAAVPAVAPPMGVPMTAETVVDCWVRFLRWEATPRLRWMWRRS